LSERPGWSIRPSTVSGLHIVVVQPGGRYTQRKTLAATTTESTHGPSQRRTHQREPDQMDVRGREQRDEQSVAVRRASAPDL
jgi:hypothetical protein